MSDNQKIAEEYALKEFPEYWIDTAISGFQSDVNIGRRKRAEQDFLAGLKTRDERNGKLIVYLKLVVIYGMNTLKKWAPEVGIEYDGEVLSHSEVIANKLIKALNFQQGKTNELKP